MENKIFVSKANIKENWQELFRLENRYLQEIGEQELTQEKQAQLFQAIRDEKITFFLLHIIAQKEAHTVISGYSNRKDCHVTLAVLSHPVVVIFNIFLFCKLHQKFHTFFL